MHLMPLALGFGVPLRGALGSQFISPHHTSFKRQKLSPPRTKRSNGPHSLLHSQIRHGSTLSFVFASGLPAAAIFFPSVSPRIPITSAVQYLVPRGTSE